MTKRTVFTAPEIALNFPSADGITPASDIWSLGVLLYYVISGYYPYDEYLPGQVNFLIPMDELIDKGA